LRRKVEWRPNEQSTLKQQLGPEHKGLQYQEKVEENNQPGEHYKKVERPLGKLILYNFLGGIFWSLGVIIGAGLVFSIIAYFIGKIDFIPILGDFLAKVIQSAQNNLTK